MLEEAFETRRRNPSSQTSQISLAYQIFGSLFPIEISVVAKKSGAKAAAQANCWNIFPVGGLLNIYSLVPKPSISDKLHNSLGPNLIDSIDIINYGGMTSAQCFIIVTLECK